jgi:hypothetical protein
METGIVVIAVAFLLICVVIKFEVLPMVYDVRLSEIGIEFVLFSCIPVYTLEFDNIEEIIEARGGYTYVFAYNYKNRFSQSCLLIRKKRGIFTRQVLITPPNPSLFIDNLARRGVLVKSTS